MTLTPLHDRIVVARREDPEPLPGAIVVPDSAKEKSVYGKVLAAGLGRLNDGVRIPLDISVGDTVLFGKYAGQAVTLDGIEYLILKEDDVLAVEAPDLAAAAGGPRRAA
jgi:chaperonin GroES